MNKLFFNYLTHTQIYNIHHLHRVLERQNRPLLSVCNHSATMDDPIVFATLPWRVILDPKRLRWTLGAKEICFTNPLFSWFFTCGQVIPIERGDGIHQPAMARATEILNQDGWIHVFSEGRVNQESEMRRFKWGIAHLILQSKQKPLVLPFFHRGMDKMIPLGTRLPRPMSRLSIVFGEPIDFNDPRVFQFKKGVSDVDERIRITAFIQSRVETLKVFLDSKHSA